MAYADFCYYANEFFGNVVPEEAFRGAAARASEYIDYLTHGRAARANDVQYPALENCCCALAELIYIQQKGVSAAASGREVKSESNGDWSQSYVTGSEYLKTISGGGQMYATVQRYLAPTGLLYRGGAVGCPPSPPNWNEGGDRFHEHVPPHHHPVHHGPPYRP